MTATLYSLWLLLAAIAAVAWVAARWRAPPPIALVVAGIALAFVPGLPKVELEPELVLLVLLPPLVYFASFSMSWRAFRDDLRPILLLSIGCVIATTVGVAVAAHAWLGLPLAAAFVLGAIVSPPDAVAPLAIAERLGIPRRIVTVLEGEGLVNDATALVLFNLAVGAVMTGRFSLPGAALDFLAVLVGETAWGLAVGFAMLRLRGVAREPRIEVMLSFMTPFAAFWPPHALGGSGVLATVVAGLYVGVAGVRRIRSDTRLQAIFFWDVTTTTITGAIFLLTGLQARSVAEGLDGATLSRYVVEGLVVCAMAIAVRFLWVFPATYLPRWLVPRIGRDDPVPHWSFPFAIAFTGLRGSVSLAAALSIPLATASGAAFPERGRLLVVTFVVIVVTLVGQGPFLPVVVRRLGLVERGRAERDDAKRREAEARIELIRTGLAKLDKAIAAKRLDAASLAPLREQHLRRIDHLERSRDDGDHEARVTALELKMLDAERDRLVSLVDEGAIGDDVRRRIEREIDLAEEKIRRNVRGIAADDFD